ncbi:MAG: DNA polymerase III subunit delta [Proteobacteria bacterium]|nr:DNA polymerase III subunit delta [Pseudomonadota bacterium]
MKLAGGKAEAFLARPASDSRGVLLFGPDEGLIRERAEALLLTVAGTRDDPFRIAQLSPDDLKGDGARLMDEARALPFGGGRRVVRLRGAADGHAEAIAAVLDDPSPLAFLIVEAGDLATRSKLRRTFEDAAAAAAVGCYAEGGHDLSRTIAGALAKLGVTADQDAIALLTERLQGDRQVLRRELEKLALYVGESGTATADDVKQAVGDSTEASLDAVVFAAAGGDSWALDRALERAFAEGSAPISLLRAAARHLTRLHLAQGYMQAGADAKGAMMKLRPPPFYKLHGAFTQQLRAWSAARIARALDLVMDAELDCKRTGFPDHALAARAMMRIAAAARAKGD